MERTYDADEILCTYLDETKKPKPIPFRFALKVFKDRQGLPDVSDRFSMIFDGTEMELESRGEDRIIIRAAGVEVVAGTFIPYLNGIDLDAQV
jgi:hypothetical protein